MIIVQYSYEVKLKNITKKVKMIHGTPLNRRTPGKEPVK